MKRIYAARKDKWGVHGEYGGTFTNLDDAKLCAREASKTPEYDYEASVYNIQDGMYYIDYENGKLVRDGWSLPLKKTGKSAKFNLDGKIIEKPMYTKPDGTVVIKHNNKLYTVSNPDA